jgi:hypothetical protein
MGDHLTSYFGVCSQEVEHALPRRQGCAVRTSDLLMLAHQSGEIHGGRLWMNSDDDQDPSLAENIQTLLHDGRHAGRFDDNVELALREIPSERLLERSLAHVNGLGKPHAPERLQPRCIVLAGDHDLGRSGLASEERDALSDVARAEHEHAIAAPMPVPLVPRTLQVARTKLLKSGRIEADHGVGFFKRSMYSGLSNTPRLWTSYSVK